MSQSNSFGDDGKLNDSARRVARGLKRPSLAPVWVSVLTALADFMVLSVTFWFIAFWAAPRMDFSGVAAIAVAFAAAILTVVTMVLLNGYRIRVMQSLSRSSARLMVASIAPVAVVLVWCAGNDALELSGPVVAVLCFGVIFPYRALTATGTRWCVDAGFTERRAVIAGGGENAETLMRALDAIPGNDIRICAMFDDRGSDRSPDLILDIPKIGRFSDLVQFSRVAEIDLIIVTLPLEAETRIAQLLRLFRVLPVPVHLSAFSKDYNFRGGHSPNSPLIPALPASFQPERRIAKRVFDLVVGSTALLFLSPLMVLAAVAIKLDSPGPILFRQLRHGYNDRCIEVLKFRTMHHCDSDPLGKRIVKRDDPRVTRIGRFLRKSSIDELPQLFNVLSGSLSLVGPRPHALDAQSSRQERFAQIVDGYSARHRLPPGITGWAQINGLRGEVDDPESLKDRVAHDLFYIENWSVWLDLLILVRTPFSLLDTRRAY